MKSDNNSAKTYAEPSLKEVLDTSSNGVIVIAPDWTISIWNVWMVTYSGIDSDFAVGKNLSEIFPNLESNRFQEAVRSAIILGSSSLITPALNPFVLPLKKRHPTTGNLEKFEHLVSISALKSVGDHAFGALVEISDVSLAASRERVLRQAKLAAEKAAASRAEVLAIMSHEIRTPLNGILGTAHLLQLDNLSEEQAGYVDIIHQSGTALLTMINSVLDLAKMETGHTVLNLTAFSIKELFNEVIALLKNEYPDKPIKLDCALAPHFPDQVYLDRVRIKQVLYNLVGNALKFTDEGSIKIEARLIGALDDKREDILISVKDTGRGIAPAQIKDLFSQYTQGDRERLSGEGTGLGLAICEKLSQLMGGRIEVESVMGEGSTFSFIIPYRVNQ